MRSGRISDYYQTFRLLPPVSHLSCDRHIPTGHLIPSFTTLETIDLLLSLPTVHQLEAKYFDLDKLVKRLTEALANDSRRNEIQQLIGDSAVLVMECLDKVSEIGSRRRFRLLIAL